MKKTAGKNGDLHGVIAQARKERESRELGYRERALKLYPWICGRCSREFTRENLLELTVHHRNHNHDDNPENGSNWELLCIYCHDNEHSRLLEAEKQQSSSSQKKTADVTHKPFEAMKDLFKKS